jgi:hypothetical protein
VLVENQYWFCFRHRFDFLFLSKKMKQFFFHLLHECYPWCMLQPTHWVIFDGFPWWQVYLWMHRRK